MLTQISPYFQLAPTCNLNVLFDANRFSLRAKRDLLLLFSRALMNLLSSCSSKVLVTWANVLFGRLMATKT